MQGERLTGSCRRSEKVRRTARRSLQAQRSAMWNGQRRITAVRFADTGCLLEFRTLQIPVVQERGVLCLAGGAKESSVTRLTLSAQKFLFRL